MVAVPHVERGVEASGRAKPPSDGASSQENIMERPAAVAITETEVAASDAVDMTYRRGCAGSPSLGISHTIELQVHEQVLISRK